jgi:hypothetical protein
MKDWLKKFSVVLTVMTFLFSSAAFAAKDANKGVLKGKPHRHHALPTDEEIPIKLKEIPTRPHPSEVNFKGKYRDKQK